MTTPSSRPLAQSDKPQWLQVVHQNVQTLRYGVVQIIVHDSKVVQVDRTEKTRMDDGS